MKNLLINYPCVCGHASNLHSITPDWPEKGTKFCWHNYKEIKDSGPGANKLQLCRCLNYISDNLLYLEQLSES